MSMFGGLIQKSVRVLSRNRNILLFFATLCYYGLLFFCNSNITLLLLSFIYFIILWKILKNAPLAAFLCFLVHLPFVKGKSFSFLVLPKDMVQMNIRRDLLYYFPFTVSDFYLLVYLWLHIREKKVTHLPAASRWIVASVVLFFLLNVLSVLWSEQYIVSLLSVIILLKFIIIFHLSGFVHFTSDVIKKMISIIASFAIFEGVWGLLQYIVRGNLGRYIESYNNAYSYGKVAWENKNLLRASGTFVDPDLYGTFSFMHFVLFFFLFITSERSTKFEKALYGLCTVLSGVSVFITGNRALYLCFALSLILILIVTKKVRYIISAIKKPIGLFVTITAIVVLFPYVSTRMQNLSAIFNQGSATFRVQIASYAAKLGIANIFGVGIGTSPYHFALDFSGAKVLFGPDYPHNIFFQVLAETGIFGLIAFIIFLYIAFRPLMIHRHKTTFICFYLAAIAYLISACFYPLYVPLIELPSFFFLYLGIATFRNL